MKQLIILLTLMVGLTLVPTTSSQGCPDISHSEPKFVLPHEFRVSDVWWNDDDTRMVTSTGMDFTIWDAKSSEKLVRVSSSGFFWNPSKTLILARDKDDLTKAHVWDVKQAIELFSPTQEGNIYRFTWSPDGTQILTSSVQDGSVRLWDSQTGILFLELNPYLANSDYLTDKWSWWNVEWSPDQKSIFIERATEQGIYIRMFDVDEASETFGEEIFSVNLVERLLDDDEIISPDLVEYLINNFQLIEESKRLMVWSMSGQLHIWDLDRASETFGELVEIVDNFAEWRQDYRYNWLKSPDGAVLLNMSHSARSVELWDIDAVSTTFGVKLLDLQFEAGIYEAWNTNTHQLAIGWEIENRTQISVWNVNQDSLNFGEEMISLSFPNTTFFATDLIWSPKENLLLIPYITPSAAEDFILIMDGDNGNIIYTFETHDALSRAQWSPQGGYVSSSHAGQVEGGNILTGIAESSSLATGCRIFSFEIERLIFGVEWNHAETQLAIGTDDGTVYVFEP